MVPSLRRAESGTWTGGSRTDLDLTATTPEPMDDMDECPDGSMDDMDDDMGDIAPEAPDTGTGPASTSSTPPSSA